MISLGSWQNVIYKSETHNYIKGVGGDTWHEGPDGPDSLYICESSFSVTV